MVGKIKSLLDDIIEQRSNGNPVLMITTKSKLLLKGIDYEKYTPQSEDDPVIVAKVKKCAEEMGIKV